MAGTLLDSFLEIVPSERSVLRFEDRRREGFITLYARKADDTILIEGGKGSIPRTFVISPTRPVQCLDGGPLPSGAYLFFKGLADQGPASIERSFMDVIDGLFSDSSHAFKPLYVRLSAKAWDNHRRGDVIRRPIEVVCDIYSKGGEYTCFLETFSLFKGRRDRLVKESVVYIVPALDTVRGYHGAGPIWQLAWFFSQNYRMTTAGRLQSCNNFRFGEGDWEMPCSNFILVRAGRVSCGPRKGELAKASEKMIAYIKDSSRFRVSDARRQQVLDLLSHSHRIGDGESNLTIRRFFTEDDRRIANTRKEVV